jgi:hypothetical protein
LAVDAVDGLDVVAARARRTSVHFTCTRQRRGPVSRMKS